MSDEKKDESPDARAVDETGNGDDEALAELAEPTLEPATLLTRVVALFPLMICFMGTGRSPWALGLMALMVGGLVLLNPPRSKLPFALVVVMGSIALLTLLPLIPIQVPFPSAWKVWLVEDIGIHLAPTWSVQPWVTLENWLSMMVIMVWFTWLVTQERVTEHRALILRMIASGIVRLYAGPDGISLVSLSASAGGTRSTRATSLIAARAFMVPNVTIWPTLARP